MEFFSTEFMNYLAEGSEGSKNHEEILTTTHGLRRSERLQAHPNLNSYIDDCEEVFDDPTESRDVVREESKDEDWTDAHPKRRHEVCPEVTNSCEMLEVPIEGFELVSSETTKSPRTTTTTTTSVVTHAVVPRSTKQIHLPCSRKVIEILDDEGGGEDGDRVDASEGHLAGSHPLNGREAKFATREIGDSDSVKRSIEKLRDLCESEIESLSVIRLACFLSLQPFSESDEPVIYRKCLATHPLRVFEAESLRASIHTALRKPNKHSILYYHKHECPVCKHQVTYRPAKTYPDIVGDDDVVFASYISVASNTLKRINKALGRKVHCERKVLLTEQGIWSIVKRASDHPSPILVMSSERLHEISSSAPVHPSFSELSLRIQKTPSENCVVVASFTPTASSQTTTQSRTSHVSASTAASITPYIASYVAPICRRPWVEWVKRTVKAMKRYLAEAKTNALRKTGHWALARLLEEHWTAALQEHRHIHQYLGLNPMDHYRQGPRAKFSAVPKTIVSTQSAFHTRTLNEIPKLDLSNEQIAVLVASWRERQRLYLVIHQRYRNVSYEGTESREEPSPPPLREPEETRA